jgi:hypothetical protein
MSYPSFRVAVASRGEIASKGSERIRMRQKRLCSDNQTSSLPFALPGMTIPPRFSRDSSRAFTKQCGLGTRCCLARMRDTAYL